MARSPCPERPAPSHRLLAACFALLSLASPRESAAAGPAFWDAYQQARTAAARAPDSVLAAARARLTHDPDDFLAAWLTGRLSARSRDSSAAGARVSGDTTTTRAGTWVVRASTALAAGRRTESRDAYARAAAAYESRARPIDAARALTFSATQAITPADSSRFELTLARAESLARGAGEPAAIADVLLARAAALYDDVPGSARGLREEAVRLLRPLGPSSQLATAHRGLGNVLKFAGELDGAEHHYREALQAATTLRDPTLMSQALGGLGNVQLARADFDSALASYTHALELARGHAGPRTLMARHGDLATLHLRLGHVREAREHLEAAERAGGRRQSELLDARSALEALAGRFDVARAVLDSAIALAVREDAPTRVPFLRLLQAQVSLDLGEPEASERFTDLGLAAARDVGHRRAEIALGVHRTELLLDAGRAREALSTARALAAACERSDPRQLGSAARLEASALAELGRTRDAFARLRREIDRARAEGDTSSLARSLAYDAELRLQRGEVRAAAARAAQAAALLAASGDTAGHATASIVAGQAALAAGRPGEALRWLRPALAYEERVSSRLRSTDDRAGHRAGWYDGSVAMAAALVETGAPERALIVLEQTRARELRRMLGRRGSGLHAHVDPALADSVEQAEQELAALQGMRLRLPRDGRAELARVDARLESVKRRHTELARRVQRSAPLYGAASARSEVPSLAIMRRALGADERVRLFMVGTSTTVAWWLDSQGLRARVLPLGERWFASRVAGLVARLEAGADRRVAAGGLGDTLFGPWPDGGSVTRLHVVPDGPLHDVPFDALEVTLPGARRTPLLACAQVNVAPSAALLFAEIPTRAFVPGATDVAAFGDPDIGARGTRGAAASSAAATMALENARREVEAVRAAFPSARVYVGERATEAAFLAEAARATVLHVAAHGFVDDRRPAYSSLALAPDPREGRVSTDGLVQAFEVADARVRAELAVLSACASGAGVLRRGEGLQGLARAFQLAGAGRLVVSRWRVEDAETADLMSTFYRRLAAGDAPAAALRAAKLESLGRHDRGSGVLRAVGTRRRAGPRAAAATWAAFVLIGPRSDR